MHTCACSCLCMSCVWCVYVCVCAYYAVCIYTCACLSCVWCVYECAYYAVCIWTCACLSCAYVRMTTLCPIHQIGRDSLCARPHFKAHTHPHTPTPTPTPTPTQNGRAVANLFWARGEAHSLPTYVAAGYPPLQTLSKPYLIANCKSCATHNACCCIAHPPSYPPATCWALITFATWDGSALFIIHKSGSQMLRN